MQEHIYWIGDSTVQFNRISTYPQCGMGQVLDLYLRPGITVHDHAVNGCSTKSFWDKGFFEPVRRALSPGDILLIQFGHNDQKPDQPEEYAAPADYQRNLLRYARIARRAGALPVLITPLTRRRFEAGALTRSHGVYPDAVRELAAREKLPLIDLTAASRAEVERLGEEASRAYYMYFGPGLYSNFPDGSDDNTHLRYEGAVRFAGMVADGLRALGEPYEWLVL